MQANTKSLSDFLATLDNSGYSSEAKVSSVGPSWDKAKAYFGNGVADVYIIGYHPKQCPYSSKANLALKAHASMKAKQMVKNYGSMRALWHIVQRGDQASQVKSTVGNTSFPVVFLRDSSGTINYLGGGTELEEYLSQQ